MQTYSVDVGNEYDPQCNKVHVNTAWVAGGDVDAAGPTSPILDVCGLTASG